MAFWRVLTVSATICAALIFVFYAHRIFMPLPLYAWDEDGFAIRALFSADAVARNSFAPDHSNGVFLQLIRLVHFLTGAHYVQGLRVFNFFAYLGGLLFVFSAVAKSLPGRQQLIWLIVAFAFPYYRYVASDLPEAAYVGLLGVIGWVTARYFLSRPLSHALMTGALAAALVLVKPHGMAVVAGLGGIVVLDTLAGGKWRLAPLRFATFAIAFFAIGNAIQWATGQPMQAPLAFFVEGFYGATLATKLAPQAVRLGLLDLLAMGSAVLLLAGPALTLGFVSIGRRWAQARAGFRLSPSDLLFLLLALSLGATLVMVTVFAMKMAADPGETKRLWGRYFEFFVPLIWLAAAPAIERSEPPPRWTRLACAGVTLGGLFGLILSFHMGVVLFPWDGTAVTAFFHTDPRAGWVEILPFRRLAEAATLLAVVGIAAGARMSRVWLSFLVALGCLSTIFDAEAMAPVINQRAALARDIRAAAPLVPPRPTATAALVTDGNDADLTFVGFEGKPEIILVTPAGPPTKQLAGVQTLITVRCEAPPGGPWKQIFHGTQISVYTRTPAPPS
jgi:hypothetical protein